MFKKQNLGFTLIELTIVIAMTGLISTVMIASFRSGEKLKRVQLAADGLASLSRLGQEYTLSGKIIPFNAQRLPDPAACAGTDRSPRNYSFNVNTGSTTAYLYATDRCQAKFQIDSFTLPQGTRIKQIGVVYCTNTCTNTSSPTSVAVYMIPPFGVLEWNDPTNPVNPHARFSQVDIVIESLDGTRTRTVRIDGISGRIGVLQTPG